MAEWLSKLLHLNEHLKNLAEAYGPWVYALMFVIIFAETGFVVTPFLPGDSLLFAAGAVAAGGGLSPYVTFVLLAAAAFLGNTVNYWIGYFVGQKVFTRPKSLFFNPEHLQRAHRLYEKYGGKTIVLARFVPIIRTFAPFVAGIGRMTHSHFVAYNLLGCVLWVGILVFAGYWFGGLPVIQKNFSLVILAIIVISMLPAVIEALRARADMKRESSLRKEDAS